MSNSKLFLFFFLAFLSCTFAEKNDKHSVSIHSETLYSDSHKFYATFELFRLEESDKVIFSLFETTEEDALELDTLDYLYQKSKNLDALSEQELERLGSPNLNKDRYILIVSDTSYHETILLNSAFNNIRFDEKEKYVYFIDLSLDTLFVK